MDDGPTSVSDIPLVKPLDLRIALMLLALTPAAWCLPERRLDSVARAIMRLRKMVKRDTGDQAAHIASVAGETPLTLPPKVCAEAFTTGIFLELLQLLRWHRPGSWHPEIAVEGTERLDRAVAAGKGAFLWTVPFSFSTLITRMGMGGAGYKLHLLSRYHHNLSDTLWGARFLNAVRLRQEAPYLAERMVIWPGTERETVNRLIDHLAQGHIVSTNVGYSARRFATVPLFEGRFRLATGPAAISLRMGAPLIPVFSMREKDGSFRVVVEEPLGPTGPDGQPTTVEAMLTRFIAILESYVVRYPDQFRWHDALDGEVS